MSLSPDAGVEEIQKAIDELKAEHASYDQQVVAFDERSWLSPEEQIERKKLQKLKLKAKDKIHALKKQLQALE